MGGAERGKSKKKIRETNTQTQTQTLRGPQQGMGGAEGERKKERRTEEQKGRRDMRKLGVDPNWGTKTEATDRKDVPYRP